MYATLLGRIQRTRWSALVIMMIVPAFSCSEMSKAAQETSEPTSKPNIELTFSGTGSGDTQAFTLEDGWKIQWETESAAFKLSAHGSAQRPYIGPTNKREEVLRWFESVQPIVLANTTDSDGTAYHPFGGTFYFKIVADGPWRIHLQTMPDTKDYLDVPYTGAP